MQSQASSDDSSKTADCRIASFDAARGIAILAMMLVHFTLVGAMDSQLGVVGRLVDFLDGKAASTFLILTGVGVSLFARKTLSDFELTRKRWILFKRGLLLLALGLINLTVWQGDILRVYGVSIIAVLAMLRWSSAVLLRTAAGFLVAFAVIFSIIDYGSHWDWETMHYHDLWTPAGVIRNIFYDGFRSVFPWTGFILLGIVVGRQRTPTDAVLRMILVLSLLGLCLVEIGSTLLVYSATKLQWLPYEDALALFGTRSMPPFPIFFASSLLASVVVISATGLLSNSRYKFLLIPFQAAGRMSLTWYILHIWVGLGCIVVFDQVQRLDPFIAMGSGLAFFVFASITSIFWMRSFGRGPAETLLRTLSG